MSYLQDLGAATGAWSQDQYETFAEAKAVSTPGNFTIVTVGREGAFARTKSYSSTAAMLADFDANYRNRLAGDVAFALVYDKTRDPGWRGIESAINPLVTDLVYHKTDWKGLVPWAIGGAAVIAAAVYWTRKKSTTTRRRSTPTWRRRITTTWR
jgi:hypothetical protein